MNESITLYKCDKCGKISISLGFLHGHMEKHNGFGPFNIFPDLRKTANFEYLMEYTTVLEVKEIREISLSKAKNLEGGTYE